MDDVFPKGQDGRRYHWLAHSEGCASLLYPQQRCTCDVAERNGPHEEFKAFEEEELENGGTDDRPAGSRDTDQEGSPGK